MSDNKATVRLDLDASDFDKEAQNVEASAGKAEKAIENIGRASKSATQYIQQNVAALKQLQDASKQYSGQSSPVVGGKRAAGPQVYAPAPSVNTDILRGFQVEPLVTFNKELKATQSLTRQHTQALDEQYSSLSNTRYALYDVSSTYRMVGLAATAALTAQVANSAEMESAFTGVERTVDIPLEKMGQLRDGLIELSRTIPESFTDIANIATIGGQLDVAGEHIESFSENVAKFASMTDASIDNTAMSFGRIDQLANSGAGSYDNIASAIYNVGVQTVATESQILKMSEEISATAALAGYSAQEIIGLAGALSSLAVQPERARGAIQKSFALISTAVNDGGAELVKFADVAGMSADDFASAWGSEPANVFKTFLTGLSSIQNLDTALADLGLNDLRVADMFKRLSGNMDVVNQAMDVSSNAWTDHSAFMEAYGLVADDLASKMKMLANDILAFIDNITDTAALGDFVDQIRNVIAAVQGIADGLKQIPVIGKVFGSAVPMVLGLVGAMALLKAGQLTLRASAYAMFTAQAHMSKNAEFADLKYRDLIKTLFGLDGASKKAAASENALAGSTHNAGNAASVASGKWSAASVTMGRLTTSVSASSKAMLGLVGGWAGLAVIAGAGVLSLIGKHMNETRQEAEALKQAFQGVSEAIMQDTSAYERSGEALRTLSLNSDGVIVAVDGINTSHGAVYQTLSNVTSQLGLATSAWDTYTIAIGTNTQEALLNAIRSNENFKNTLINAIPMMETYGITMEEVLNGLATGNIDTLIQKFSEIEVAADRAFGVAAERAGTLGEGFEGTAEYGIAANEMIELLNTSSEIFGETLRDLSFETMVASEGLGYAGESAEYAADGFYNGADGALSLADSMIAALEGPMAFEQAMYNLGGSLAENGSMFDIYSEAGRANMSSLSQVVSAAVSAAGGDTQALASMLAQALATIGGVNSAIGMSFAKQAQVIVASHAAAAGVAAPNVTKLASAMRSQSGEAGYNAKMNDLAAKSSRGAGSGARDAAKGASAAAKEVRTLTDYVKDLSSVMKSAFDFRWGLEIAVDNAADAFQKLKDMKTDALERVQDAFDKFEGSQQKITDLRIALADLQADINGLSADKGTLEYQLKVARDYGDSLREKEILAKLEKVQTDMAKAESDRASKTTDLSRAERDQVKASKELADAQRDVKRDLSGTTASSREQRSAVLALVSSYQDQVEQLANSGLSSQQLAIETEKLRQKFVAQMLQLGYSRAEAEKYSRSFQDMTTIINKIPRNITISANANPAQRAIDEFMAKNSKGRGASGGISVPVTPRIGGVNTGGLQRQLNNAGITVPIRPRIIKDYIHGSIAGKTAIIGSVYYRGGFTGRGGKYDTAGIVHRGEYVIPKEHVDQSTGLPYLSALGDIMQGSRASRQSSSMSAAMPTSMVVELSPTDRKLISDGGTAVVVLDGKVIASSVNRSNANSSRRGA